MVKFVQVLLLTGSFFMASNLFAFDHSYAGWQKMLDKYVNAAGDVAYAKWKANDSDLKLFEGIQKEFESLTMAQYNKTTSLQKKTFLINAYNLFTVKLILDNYTKDLKTIKKIGGLFTKPWRIEFFSLLGGEIKYLDSIEHKWLRVKFKDARIHAAVNCASVSCPKLYNKVYLAKNLNAQLDIVTKEWLADSSKNKFDLKSQAAEVSGIFSWYKGDFGGDDKGVRNFLVKYGPKSAKDLSKAKSDFKISHLKYNWNLNKQ